jgi:hypothetical protein
MMERFQTDLRGVSLALVEIRLFYFWSFDRMRVRMTAVSLNNSKADRSDDSAERSGAGGIGRGNQQWQEQYAPRSRGA